MLELTEVGDLLREYAESNLGRAKLRGDEAWVFQSFDFRCLTKAEPYGTDAVSTPKPGTNAKRLRAKFLSTMTNPTVDHDQ